MTGQSNRTPSFEQEVLKSDTGAWSTSGPGACGPCTMIGPSLEEISKEMDGKLKVVKVNIDETRWPRRATACAPFPPCCCSRSQVAATKIGAEPKQKLVSWSNTASVEASAVAGQDAPRGRAIHR